MEWRSLIRADNLGAAYTRFRAGGLAVLVTAQSVDIEARTRYVA